MQFPEGIFELINPKLPAKTLKAPDDQANNPIVEHSLASRGFSRKCIIYIQQKFMFYTQDFFLQ